MTTHRLTATAAASIVLVLAIGLGLAVSADAKPIKGTQSADVLRGTPGKDKIKARGGDDRVVALGGKDVARGGAGADRVNGGAGRDNVKGGGGRDALTGAGGKDVVVGGGGGGKDSLRGGPGADVLRSADGVRDLRIDGGKGKNKCVIDAQLDLEVTRNCSSIHGIILPPGPDDPVVPPGTVPPGDDLVLEVGNGLLGCQSIILPSCEFDISGLDLDGVLDILNLSVIGTGGVIVGPGLKISVDSLAGFRIRGFYSCLADGVIRIGTAQSQINVPITCATA